MPAVVAVRKAGSVLGVLTLWAAGLVFWGAVAVTGLFFILFYVARIIIGGNGWTLSESAAWWASTVTLSIPIVGAILGGSDNGTMGVVGGAWLGLGFMFWVFWAMEDAMPPKIRRKWRAVPSRPEKTPSRPLSCDESTKSGC